MYRIFFPLYLLIFVQLFFYDTIYEVFFYLTLEEIRKDDIAADYYSAFYLVEKNLSVIPPTQWRDFLASISTHSNFPYQLESIDTLKISSEGLYEITQGNIWVDDIEWDILYKQVPGSDFAVKIGPMNTIEGLEESAENLNLLLSSSFIVLLLIWALLLQRKINLLNQVTLQFGQGALSVRASEKGGNRVGQLNRVFNQMAQRVQRLIQSHKDLTNAVSHELRTPITRLRFELEFLGDSPEAKHIAPSLASMAEDIDELDTLVDELLTHAKLEREGKKALYKFNVSDWMSRWIDSYKPLSEDIQLVPAYIQPAVDVFADESYLDRAMSNLVGNAFRYAEHNVEISAFEENGKITIYVDDDGIGIPEVHRDSLFDPFQRIDKSRSKKTGGFGLGLAIVKQIAESHNGSITIEDSPLGGARFVLRWPLRTERD